LVNINTHYSIHLHTFRRKRPSGRP
jgi:hypothetical protein